VAIPISPAAGMSETAAVRNTQIETPLVERSQRLTGAATSSQLSQLLVRTLNNCVATGAMTDIMGQVVSTNRSHSSSAVQNQQITILGI
jgi:hypothetical protein